MRHKKLLLVFVGLLVASLAVVGVSCGGPKAEFELSNLVISPTKVGLGQTVTVTADVENVGGEEGTITVELKIGGTVEDSKEVTLAEGESEMVTFTASRDAEATYVVKVNGLTATLTVGEGGEGALPALNLGDRWVYDLPWEGGHATWTAEVTGQEMIGGKDCYVVDFSIDTSDEEFLTDAKEWLEKETLWMIRMHSSGEYMGFPYLVSGDVSYEGLPLFPLAVGQEVEITETDTTTITIMGETETQTKTRRSTYKVEKIEDITVAAGTFRCFKIVEYYEYGSALDTTWYSDEVKTPYGVKVIGHKTRETSELQSYSVQ